METPLECIVCGNLVADIIGRPISALGPRHGDGHTNLEQVRFFTGGFACNVSIDLAKLGVRAGVISRVGNDVWRDLILQPLQQHGVDLTGVVTDPVEQTAATMVCVDASGERTFYHTYGAQKNFGADELLRQIDYVRRTGIVAVGYYGHRPDFDKDLPRVFKALKSQCDAKILLDTSGSVGPTLPDLARSLPYLDFFIPSYREAKSLTGLSDPVEMVKMFRDHGASKLVGVKLGGDGCILDDGESQVRTPAFPVTKVVDTTGAGDSFMAGIVTAWLHDMPLEQMARFANAVGSCCVQALGASTGIRSFEETMKLLR